MRAIQPDFLQADRPVSGEQFSRLDRAGAGLVALRAVLGFVGGLRLLGGHLLAQRASDLLAGLVSALLDRGEVEGVGSDIPREQVAAEKREELLELGVLREIRC